jgi:hypothetical protein
LTEDVPFYVDEPGRDQKNEGWKETGAPTGNRIYKDIGLKVQAIRDDI